MDFGIMFFSSVAPDSRDGKYQLLLEAIKYVDQQDFCSVWTPERHFHQFGGLFPNPSLMSAAIATITKNVQIRAGSLVAPLHHPIRMVEDWSVVDNLSGGRAAVSFGSGWNINDFVFFPERYEQRQGNMYQLIETFKALWQGKPFIHTNHMGDDVELYIYPKPIQKELPIWITSSGNTDTFVSAGAIGANLLTHMEHQTDDVLKEKIGLYRDARQKNGFDPHKGKVSLMLHTFLGAEMDSVKEKVREPMRNYLRSAVHLEQKAIGGGGTASGGYKIKPHEISEADMEDLLDFLFERYFSSVALLGTVDHCKQRIQKLKAVGVDEVACLIDFLDDEEAILGGLPYLNQLRHVFSS